ncbi:Dullard phosphatase domain, eukaryotic [Artemisia annua]|uniref:Dullard phosphatase domain, eukaryotic n=1 Tax=Artemisia annua TaxID=35608 RepID=A0A2U1NCQ2_ARTAN|nr:Dullard phosphatase domain, eukaryotic [Artemisia annua]
MSTTFPSPMPLSRSPQFAGNSAQLSTHGPSPCALPPPTLPNQRTVFLDLDHTLICAISCPPSLLPPQNYDFLVKNDHNRVRYVRKRPYVDEFLKYLSQKNFEIVVFTAAEESYASVILDKLDPKGLISHRLYRKSCKRLDGRSVKDLSDLGRDLKNVVIIDDQPTSYRLQPENAIPIRPFIDELQDHELKKLMDNFFDDYEQYEDLKDAIKHYLEVEKQNRRGRLIGTRFDTGSHLPVEVKAFFLCISFQQFPCSISIFTKIARSPKRCSGFTIMIFVCTS